MAASGSKSSQHNPHKAIVDEMLHCIDVAADFEDGLVAKQTGRRTWVAVKIVCPLSCSHSWDTHRLPQTALLPDASALIRLSSHIISIRPPTLPPQVAFPGNPTSSDLDILYAPKLPKEILSDTDLAMLRDLHADLERICTRAQARGVRIIVTPSTRGTSLH